MWAPLECEFVTNQNIALSTGLYLLFCKGEGLSQRKHSKLRDHEHR